MPPKAYNRGKNKRRSNSPGISKEIDDQLVIDIKTLGVSSGDKTPSSNLLHKRLEVYGAVGSTQYKTAYDRLRALLVIKTKSPVDYW